MNKKAVWNADLFWADKSRLLCAEATGFNLRGEEWEGGNIWN